MFKNLLRRRVFQVVGIYLGALFALLEFTGLIVERYGLTDNLIDLVLIGLLSMLPTVIMVAYYHGAPGKDEFNRVEKVGIPVNALATVALLAVLTQGQQVSATSETRTVTDEHGQQLVMEVAKESFIQSVNIYFLDNQNLDEDEAWLSYALPTLIGESLGRDSFVDSKTIYGHFNDGPYWRIRRAGYADALNLPLTLQRQLSEEYHSDYFVRGHVGQDNDQYVVAIELYETETLDAVGQAEFRGGDIFALVDEAIPYLKNLVNVQRASSLSVDKLKSSELVTASLPALQALIEGRNALLFHNDADAAIAHWQTAIELDPQLVQAHMDLSRTYAQQGDFQGALTSLQHALQHAHKMTDQQQIMARAFRYELQEEPEMALGVYEMWVQLYPDRPEPHFALGWHLMQRGGMEDFGPAVESFETSLQLDPTQEWAVLQIANLLLAMGREEEATERFKQYHELRPNQYLPLVAIGDIKLSRGDFEGARVEYEKGAVAESQMVTPVLRLAQLALRQGNVRGSRNRIDDASFVAQAPRQQASLLHQKILFLRQMGRPKEAWDLVAQLIETRRQYGSAVDLTIEVIAEYVDLAVEAGKTEEAFALLETDSQQYQGPLAAIGQVGYISLYLTLEQPEQAAPHIDAVEALLNSTAENAFMYRVKLARGMQARLHGEFDLAIDYLEQAKNLVTRSMYAVNHIQDRAWIETLLADTLLAAGEPQRAKEVAAGVMVSWPYHTQANLVYARASEQLSQFEDMAMAMQRLDAMWVDAEPDHPLSTQLAALKSRHSSVAGAATMSH